MTPPSIEGIDRLINIEKLSLEYVEAEDYSYLSGLTHLNELSLLNVGGFDVDAISTLPVEKLRLLRTSPRDLSPLSQIEELQSLYILLAILDDEVPRPVDLNGIGQAKQLESLTIIGGAIADIAPLAGMDGLVQLELTDVPDIDLSPLASLDELESLTLEWSSVTSIAPLAGCESLVYIDIENTYTITDFGTLEAVPGLTIHY